MSCRMCKRDSLIRVKIMWCGKLEYRWKCTNCGMIY